MVLIAAFTLLQAGCSIVDKAEAVSPAATITSGALKVQQTGDAQKPANVQTKTETRTVPLPQGTELVFDDKLGTVTLRLARDTILKTETRTDRAEGPQAFTPPAPPSPADAADAKADFWSAIGYRGGLIIGIAAGLFGLVRGWDFVMWGGGALAGACAFGLFVQRHPALFAIMAGGVVLAAVGPYFWHRYVKHLNPSTDGPKI